jgi:hypothetical protein
VQHMQSEGLKIVPLFSNYTTQQYDELLS